MQQAALEAEWEKLAARCGAEPFARPAFVMPTARWLAPPGVLEVVLAQRDRQLTAVLPLVRRGGRLVALRSMHTPRFDMVGAAADLWRVLRDQVAWHTLDLGAVPHDSPLLTELVAYARADRFRVHTVLRSRAPVLALDGFEERLDGHFRRNLKARRRKLGDLELERVANYDETALADLFQLEAAAWKGDAGTAIASSAATVAFYRDLAARFAPHGALSLTFLRHAGRRIAAHFALEDGDTYYLLKPGYDPEFAAYGPGHLHIYETAVDARRRGLRTFDFLGQDLAWKRSWTSEAHPQVALELYRPSLRGRVAYALKHRVRPVLGALKRRLTASGAAPPGSCSASPAPSPRTATST
ncbi:MAG TPA: GNAT family N-acetyltransferase [Kofleriaceae bacterium]|jgi:CelD/BcsL family acetyltransferase involved in cellulose biosynthesis|nr:GNAT family N-acetyltransferase [Kofleriaceae bacterium]